MNNIVVVNDKSSIVLEIYVLTQSSFISKLKQTKILNVQTVEHTILQFGEGEVKESVYGL